MWKRNRVAVRLLGAVLVCMGMATALISTAFAQIPDVPGWELSWHDEFDGPSVDTSKWEIMNRQNSFNNEKQYYTPSQVSIVDGKLRITATNQPLGNKQFRSGLLTSKALFGPGRFEARMDLPTTQGMWPAFWLNANNVQWPLGGEIDILENRGSQPTLTSSAFHWQKDPGPCCGQHQYVFENYTRSLNGVPVNFHAGFHTYAVEWETTQIRFYVDNQLHFTVNKTAAMSDMNFTTAKNIILNLAVGGDFGGDPDGTTVFPQNLDVDYVRLWQKQTGTQGDFNGDDLVDASDYTVWRDSLGKEGIGLAADGSGNGTVDAADFEIWRTQFGATGGGSSFAGSVPEPASVWLLIAALGLLRVRRR